MSSESIDLYNSKIYDYESDSQLDQYNLNNSLINDSKCSFAVNSDNTYETETEYSSSQYSSNSDTDFSENILKKFLFINYYGRNKQKI